MIKTYSWQCEGWDSFDQRRRSKLQKQLEFRAGFAAFDEGADKNWYSLGKFLVKVGVLGGKDLCFVVGSLKDVYPLFVIHSQNDYYVNTSRFVKAFFPQQICINVNRDNCLLRALDSISPYKMVTFGSFTNSMDKLHFLCFVIHQSIWISMHMA